MKTRFALLLVALLGLATPALALSGDEAETVVGLMEAISGESGEAVYHGGGDAFFDLDFGGLIGAAGFDQPRWSAAYDEVVTGYMATLSDAEFEAIFAEPLARLEASALAPELKAEMQADMAALIEDARQARQAGVAHVEPVRPFIDRLHVLFFGS